MLSQEQKKEATKSIKIFFFLHSAENGSLASCTVVAFLLLLQFNSDPDRLSSSDIKQREKTTIARSEPLLLLNKSRPNWACFIDCSAYLGTIGFLYFS